MVNYGYKKYDSYGQQKYADYSMQTYKFKFAEKTAIPQPTWIINTTSSSLSIVFLADRRRARHGLPLIMLSKGLSIIFLSALTSVTILF